jgi:uncharacterized protein YqeY
MPAETSSLQTRLRNDLRAAMKERDAVTTLTLRSLLEAMDNACAVPMTAEHVQVYGRSGDVTRRVVTEDEYAGILRREADSRQAAALEYERLGRSEAAAQVRAELDVVLRYTEA